MTLEQPTSPDEGAPSSRVENIDLAREAAEVEKPYRDQARGGDRIAYVAPSGREISQKGFELAEKQHLDDMAVDLSTSYIAAMKKVPTSHLERGERIAILAEELTRKVNEVLSVVRKDYPRSVAAISNQEKGELFIDGSMMLDGFNELFIDKLYEHGRTNYCPANGENSERYSRLCGLIWGLGIYKKCFEALQRGELVTQTTGEYITVEDEMTGASAINEPKLGSSGKR